MKAQTYRDMGRGELQARMDELYQEQFNLRRAVNLGRLEDTSRVEAVKRDIARIKTILRERERPPDPGLIKILISNVQLWDNEPQLCQRRPPLPPEIGNIVVGASAERNNLGLMQQPGKRSLFVAPLDVSQ